MPYGYLPVSYTHLDVYKRQGHYCDLSGKALSKGILSVEKEKNSINLRVDPFLYRYDFKLTGKIGEENICVTKQEIDEVIVEDLDTFVEKEENGVSYRLYEPEGRNPRPVSYTHLRTHRHFSYRRIFESRFWRPADIFRKRA